MSAGAVPAPGTQYGPCDGEPECAHRDCDASRRTARAICPSCQLAIGYETPYFINLDRPEVPDGPEHALCTYRRTDR